MIERFNFYDVYGYLIPGFVWLMLLALPFHLLIGFGALGAAELTAALVLAYAVGHILSGLARDAFPTEKFDIGAGKKVRRSVAVLSPDYKGEDALPAKLKGQLRARFVERLKFDPFDPFDAREIEQMFFLCRTALSQAKLGSYVEQYQGMMTLTRSLALGFKLVAIYYAAWVIGSVVASIVSGAMVIWPLLTLIVGIVVADRVTRVVEPPKLTEPEPWIEGEREKRERDALKKRIEWQTMALTLAFAGFSASVWWKPLPAYESHALAVAAAVAWVGGLRFRNASDAFDGFLVSAVYRDFVVLSTAKPADAKRLIIPE